MRNLIFARHCYKFKAKYLQDYASVMLPKEGGQYVPETTDVSLGAIEKENVKLIQKADFNHREKIRNIAKNKKKYDFRGEQCYLENLIGKDEQLVCLGNVVIDKTMLALLSVDQIYRDVYSLGTATGLDGLPDYALILNIGKSSSGNHEKVILPEFGPGPLGEYVFNGTAILTTTERDVELAAHRKLSDDELMASETLRRFFKLLHDKKYEEAANIFGGDYYTLHYWNPKETEGSAALFKAGCEMNGLVCMEVLRILSTIDKGSGEFESILEFSRDGTTAFRPCTELGGAPIDTKLRYSVKKEGGRFLAMGMPPYCQ